MAEIPDNFNGYLNIDNDIFVYSITDFIVTLLPAHSSQEKRYDSFLKICLNNSDPEYLFGEHNNFKIAILRKDKFVTGIAQPFLPIQFATPLIIKAIGNGSGFYSRLTNDWNMFDAITFYGGNINSLYRPELAIEPNDIKEYLNNDGTRKIKIRPWKEYTQNVKVKIGNEQALLTISISQSGEHINKEYFNSYNLGELNSFIRLSFYNAQSFEMIEKYYIIIRKLIAILTRQNNIYFNVYLSQRGSDNLYYRTANCKFYENYVNYSRKNHYNVISFDDVIEYIPNLINKIENKDIDSILFLLPEDNTMVNKVSIINIQDICTALEVSYKWNKRKRIKDNNIETLKKYIKETINEFQKNHPKIDIYNQTTISSAFQYLDYTLKDKILTLYDENNEIIDKIISKWKLPPMTEENVSSFVKLRNQKTHSSAFNINNSINLYPALLALVYICLFKYIELPDEKIKAIILSVFNQK